MKHWDNMTPEERKAFAEDALHYAINGLVGASYTVSKTPPKLGQGDQSEYQIVKQDINYLTSLLAAFDTTSHPD